MVLTRTEMEATPFATYERRVREELTRLFGPWGFRAADDIAAITVNRWAHGYTFSSLPGERKSSRKTGHAKLGRISFAGADMAGDPWTQSAISEAHRAAMEQM
jgi:spermidine dehydrogenase